MKLQGCETRACLVTYLLTHLLTYLLTHSLTCKHDMDNTLTRPLPDMSTEMYTQQAVYGHEQHTPSTQMQTLSVTDKEAVNSTVMKHYHSAPWQRLLLCFANASVLTHLPTHLHSYLLTHTLTYLPTSSLIYFNTHLLTTYLLTCFLTCLLTYLLHTYT